jgi:ABC-type multidrug transport system permease subunit
VAVIGKFFVSILVFVAIFLFSYWLLFVQVIPENLPWLATAAAFLTAAALAGLTWRGMSAEAPGVLGTTMAWAGIVGAVGFCGGFFGPMVLAPQANQGPLLGLFITGPLGFVGGAIGGLIHGLWRRSQTRTV